MVDVLENSQNISASPLEVLCITRSVESDKITAQNSKQKILAHWEDLELITGGERGVQKESDSDGLVHLGSFFAEHCWKEEEVIVMDPDEISVSTVGCKPGCKELIHFLVGFPVVLLESEASLIVEKRPKSRVYG